MVKRSEPPWRRAAALPAVLAPGGQGTQSAFDVAGPEAGKLLEIGWVLFAGGTAVFLVTMAALVWALVTARTATDDRDVRRRAGGMIVAGGIAMPAVLLTALMVYVFLSGRALTADPGDEPLRITVLGRQWWWEVRYPTPDGDMVTANELRIPVGRPVEVVLEAPDVIHSFWVPSLAGKLDMIPGRTNRLVIRADRAGIYRGQCAEFCGIQHALMAFYVVAEEPDAYRRWFEDQMAPARKADTPELETGRSAFQEAGCPACHLVRGETTEAQLGKVPGPDLTHVGGRISIAAGTLPNGVGSLGGWIAGAQHIKPGNHMPSFDQLPGDRLRALAAYLDSLK